MPKRPPEPPADIPAWVMTFSDVITLLMTFFILLLTFATNEPESFEQMHEVMFSGTGANGIAGSSGIKDAVLFRQRSAAGRSTSRGSEIPPMESAPTHSSMKDGIAGLESDESRVLSTTHTIRMLWSELIDAEGKLTSVGGQRLRMLAFQLRRQNLSLRMMVGSTGRFDAAMHVVQHLVNEANVPTSEIGLGQDTRIGEDVLQIEITKRFESTRHGA